MKCYFLNPTDRVARYLRRYSRAGDGWTCAEGYQSTSVRIEDEPVRYKNGDKRQVIDNDVTLTPELLVDARWPARCECGYEYKDTDERLLNVELIYSRSDNCEPVTLREAGPGAMWDATWYPWKGPDGRSLVVNCPNGFPWSIDGPASNCTMPDDHAQKRHHCWTRTGTPPLITVGKEFGPTCNAGGGSIQARDYHGFLRNGEFT
jgi:hypothetical protein